VHQFPPVHAPSDELNTQAAFLYPPWQILAVKSDYLPEAYTRRLGKIYDCLPSMSTEEVAAIICREYGLPAEDVFMFFDPNPVAAASISQARVVSVSLSVTPCLGDCSVRFLLRSPTNMDPKRARERAKPHWKKMPFSFFFIWKGSMFDEDCNTSLPQKRVLGASSE